MQPCPVTGCTRKRQTDHVMCGICWAGVPRSVQSAVYRAWSRFNKHTISFEEYMAERQVAIDHAEAAMRLRQGRV